MIPNKLNDILSHKATIPVSVGVVSVGVGYFLGYVHGKRNGSLTVISSDSDEKPYEDPGQLKLDFETALYERLADKYDTKTDLDIRSGIEPVVISQEDYISMTGDEEKLNELIETVEEDHIDESLVDEGEEDDGEDDEELEEPETVRVSVFADSLPDWDYEHEVAGRSPAEPYIIHVDEFFANESDYIQNTLTYYAGDDIMVDEADVLVYNYKKLTGPLRFGHGSNDNSVVYIQNDKYKAQYEVVKHSGHYSVEILGNAFEEETEARDLKVAADRKFRDD